MNADKMFVLEKSVESNRLIRSDLIGMKIFGYMQFEDQKQKSLHSYRGVFLSVSFILFNVSQVSIWVLCVKLLSEQI